MKNWLYIPFLFLIALTYSRVSENYNKSEKFNNISRLPASVEIENLPECLDLPKTINPHFLSQGCL